MISSFEVAVATEVQVGEAVVGEESAPDEMEFVMMLRMVKV